MEIGMITPLGLNFWIWLQLPILKRLCRFGCAFHLRYGNLFRSCDLAADNGDGA